MRLQAEVARFGPDIAVVRVSGGMTTGETDALISLVQVLLDCGEKKLIVEVSGIQEIDSLGGTSLIRCFFAAREAGTLFCVAAASDPVAKLFETTRVNTLIAFLPTLAAAGQYLTSSLKASGPTP